MNFVVSNISQRDVTEPDHYHDKLSKRFQRRMESSSLTSSKAIARKLTRPSAAIDGDNKIVLVMMKYKQR